MPNIGWTVQLFMNLNIKNIYLILCIIDITLCIIYWLFDFAKELINRNSIGTTKTVKVIDEIQNVIGNLAVVLFDVIAISGLIYIGYICFWVASPLSKM